MNELIWLAIISSTFTCSGISRNVNKVFMSDTSTGVVQKVENYPLEQIQFYRAQKLDILLSDIGFEVKIDNRPLCKNCRAYLTLCSFNKNTFTADITCYE